MKVHYRKFTLIEQMHNAIRTSTKPIAYFEVTQREFDTNYSSFDRTQQNGGSNRYTCKGIEIRIKNED